MSHFTATPTDQGFKVVITNPAPPWTQEDSKALSDYFYAGPKIVLNQGTEIILRSVRQYLGYSSILEGIPWGPQYEWLINQTTRWFKERHKGKVPAFCVIPPILQPLPFAPEKLAALREFYGREPVSIGPVVCEGNFESNSLARNGDGSDGSELTVIWFQDSFLTGMPDHVIEQIKALDWAALAENFDW